jgi:streptomycin 3"-adenylyltransferase
MTHFEYRSIGDELHRKQDTPPSAVGQLQRLCDLLRQSLPELVGAILHGSAASAGFEPDRSDLDVLAIVSTDPDKQKLVQVGKGILMISNDPHPLELSIVSHGALVSWQHPCPHLFNFGEDHRERFESSQFLPQSPTDDDLAMHLVVARARGIDLTGTFPVSGLPEIPRSDYLSAVLSDFEWAQDRDEDLSEYLFSNACRTLAYLEDEVILSKSEGRQWCANRGIDTATVTENVIRKLRRINAS